MFVKSDLQKERMVGSDIVLGLILVYKHQHSTRQQLDVVDAPLLTNRLRWDWVVVVFTIFLCPRHSKNGGGALSVTPVRASVRYQNLVSA